MLLGSFYADISMQAPCRGNCQLCARAVLDAAAFSAVFIPLSFTDLSPAEALGEVFP